MKNRIVKSQSKTRIRKSKRLILGVILNIFIFTLLAYLLQIDKSSVFSEAYDQIAPRTPQDLQIKIGKNKAVLSWNENLEDDLYGYAIYLRTKDEKEASEPVLIGKNGKYTIKDISSNKQYFVSIAARDKNKNESEKTKEIGFSPDDESLKSFKVAGWIQASADLEEARGSFINNSEVFSSISPFWYSAQENGAIEKRGDIINSEVALEAQDSGVGIIPSITNNYDKDGKVSKLLENNSAVQSHIDIIVDEVINNDYAGIDIDYENLDPDVRKEFTKFIQKLADRLHKEDKVLSVTVQAKKSDGSMWSGAGAMDFRKLGKIVDQFRVMTYDYSRVNTAPGPVAPAYWVEEVIEYALSKVPNEKVYVGVPFYAYQWCTSAESDTCYNKGLTWEGVNNIINKYDPVMEWDANSKSPWFMYVDDEGNTKIVYYEDEQSIEAKLDIVKELDVAGIAIWRLGSENPNYYRVIREKLGRKIKPPVNLVVVPGDEQIKLSWKKSDDQNIKGYRIFIKEKVEKESLEDVAEEDRKIAEIIKKYQLDSTVLGEESFNEEFIDIYDENEYTFENLKNDRSYYISVMSLAWKFDADELELTEQEVNNRTSSEVVVVPSDVRYPMQIEDLFTEDVGSSTVDLSWTASGDDSNVGNAADYDIRFSTEQITEYNFSEAYEYEHTPTPNDSGEKQSWQVRGLEPGEEYYVAMKVRDESGNVSDLSNVIKVRTIDNIAPQTPSIPAVQALDGEIFVSWDANIEEDLAGYKLFWKKEGEEFNIVELNKDNRHYSIMNLENGGNYHVSLLAYDTNGNESLRSEDVVIAPQSNGALSGLSGMFGKYGSKLQGALSIFAGRLFNEKAIPFIVVLSVLIVNYIIFQGIKREIKGKTTEQSTPKPVKTKSGRVVDLKNIRRVIK